MACKNQIHANRNNAAKSTGPKSETGKAASSRNALKHGFCSEVPLHHLEPREGHRQYLDSYVRRFQPIDQVEYDCVEQLAESRWRRKRMISVETCLLDLEIGHRLNDTHETYEGAPAILHIALCFKDKHGSHSHELLRRYISSAERSYARALHELRILQGDRFNQPEPAASEASTAQILHFPEPSQSLFIPGAIVPKTPSETPKAA